MARANQQYYADNVGLKKDGREFYLNDELLAKLENVPSVIDNVTSTSATDALSANMGRALQDQINQLSSVGTFLSLWDCTTGLPETDPAVNPYQYKTWDYYIVSKIAEEGEDNYRPRWTQYDVGVASTVVETEDIQVWDWYLYDWGKWIKQDNTGKEYPIDDALSPTSTNAVENRVVTAKFDEYYNKDEIDEKEKWYIKFWDNEVDDMETYISDANWNYIEFYPSWFYVENEDWDAEGYNFFGDYRIARLNETMRWFPLPERWDDISHICNLIRRWQPVYFYEKESNMRYNIRVASHILEAWFIRSYMDVDWKYLDVLINEGDICDGTSRGDARLVYQDSYTWHFLPDNNEWNWKYFSYYKETTRNFTIKAKSSTNFAMWFEYKLKVKNSGNNEITVTLWNNLLNPRNIPTTVAPWKEVIFLFYTPHSTSRQLLLAQRIEYPFGWSGGDTVFFPFPAEWDDVSDLIDALDEGKYVVLTLWEDDREFYAIYDYIQGSEFSIYIPWAKDNCTFMLDWTEVYEINHNRDNSVPRSALNWTVLPSNNTMNQTNIWFFKTTSANFTLHATADPNKRAIEKYCKITNNWANDITVILWNNIDNPFNVDTTVKAGKEVVFILHSNSNNPRWSLWDRLDWTNYWALIDALQWDVDTLESDVADLQDNKADKSDTYTKSETDSLLDEKADKSDTYTKAEVDSKIDDIDLTDYYKKSETYSKTETDWLLDDKADKSTTYTKTETDNLLDAKVDDTELANYYNKTETDTLLDAKADKSELPTLTTQIQTTPWEPITALVKDGDNELRFDVAWDTIEMDFTNENGSNTRFLSTKEYVDEKTEQATDDTLGTVKTNSEKWIRLDDDWVLEIDGRRGKFPTTTWLYVPDNRDPRNVADYSVMVTDALWMNMTANRSLAIVSGYWVTCQSAPAGSTVYKLNNTYANRLKAKCCEWWFISLDEPTSKVKRIVPVTSVLIWGQTFHPNSDANSTTPIEITVEETVNPDRATTGIRLFGTMNSYASLHIWNWVSSGQSGRSLMIGWGVTKRDGNDNCMVWMDMYATGNGNAMFGRYHIARKNRWFLAGTGHDTTNARTEWASAVWEYSMIDANTLFAVGNGTSHTARSNAFEVRADGIVLKSPNWTRYKISVDDSGTLTTTAI